MDSLPADYSTILNELLTPKKSIVIAQKPRDYHNGLNPIPSLEILANAAFGKYTRDIGRIILELEAPFHSIAFSRDENEPVLYEFKLDPDDNFLVAGFHYILDKNNQRKLDKIIYRRRGHVPLVIIYKNGVPAAGWNNPKNIINIYLDIGGIFAQELQDSYTYYKELEKWRKSMEMLKEMRKQEEGVIMLA